MLSADDVDRAVRPRQGVVLEVLTGDEPATGGGRVLSFAQAEGPLGSYSRRLELAPPDEGRYQASQEVELKVGLPWWSWLLAWPLRQHLGSWAPASAPADMPWWAPPERLDRRTARLMCCLAALVAVQGFLAGLLPATLSYASSQMHVGNLGQGTVFGAVELASLPALLALVVADKRGRRGVVVWATGGAVALSALSALSPGLAWLAGGQVGVGALLTAAATAATVLAVEEVPKGCRAWALGALGLAAAFGAGFPLALLPLAGLGPGAWRWIYALSLAGLPVVVRCARQLPESRRWQAGAGRAPWSSPGGRLALVCAGAALFALFVTPASQFETQFLRHQRHYSAWDISVLEQVAGTLGGLGVIFGGRLADTHGRRPVAAVSVVGTVAATLGTYFSHSELMWTAAIVAQFFLYATGPALGVYGAELFATASRARSAGLVAAAGALGGVIGTVATGAIAHGHRPLGPALALLSVGPLVLIVLLVVAYPETAAVELEALTPASEPPPRPPRRLSPAWSGRHRAPNGK